MLLLRLATNFKKRVDAILEWTYTQIKIVLVSLYIFLCRKLLRKKLIIEDTVMKEYTQGGVCLYWHESLYGLLFFYKEMNTKSKVVVANTELLPYWKGLFKKTEIKYYVSNTPFWVRSVLQKREQIFVAYDGPIGPSFKKNEALERVIDATGMPSFFAECYCSRSLRLGRGWNAMRMPMPFSFLEMRIIKLTNSK